MPIHLDPEEARITLRRNGYKPVPIKTGQKYPTENDWPTICKNADESAIHSWKTKLPRCRSTGILTGEVVCADIDVLDEPLACAIEALAYDVLGPSPLNRIGLPPKRVLVYRAIEPFNKIDGGDVYIGERKHKIEVLGRGQQFVAFGVHPDTHLPYEWIGPSPCDVPLEQLPIVTEAQCREFVSKANDLLRKAGATSKPSCAAASTPNCDPKTGSKETSDPYVAKFLAATEAICAKNTSPKLADVVAALDHISADNYSTWINCGIALKHDFGEAGYGIYDKWSSKSAAYQGAAETRTKWDTFKPTGKITCRSIFWIAREEQQNPLLAEMNEKHAVILNFGNKTAVVTFGEPIQVQTFTDFKNRYSNRFVFNADGKKKSLGTWWLAHSVRRQYDHVEFLPGRETPEGVYNLWRGWPFKPIPGNCQIYLDLMRENICNGNLEHYNWLLDYMAHSIQKPWEPPQIAVVLRGGSGIGKGVFVQNFGLLMSSAFIALRDPHHAIGHFNALLHEKLVVYLDESFAANDKKIDGILKGLITEHNIVIEKKFFDAFDAARYFALILSSNKSWVVPAEIDDRRFFMLDANADRKGDYRFFEALDNQMKTGGSEALMHLLMTRDISNFNHRSRPETGALATQKIYSLHGADRVICDMLSNRTPPVARADGERIFISTHDLFVDLHPRCSETALAKALSRAAEHNASIRLRCDGVQKSGFWLPRLSTARAYWADKMKLSVVWPDDDGHWAGCEK